MENLILAAHGLLRNNKTVAEVRDLMISRGVREEDIFLVIQAAKLLIKTIEESKARTESEQLRIRSASRFFRK